MMSSATYKKIRGLGSTSQLQIEGTPGIAQQLSRFDGCLSISVFVLREATRKARRAKTRGTEASVRPRTAMPQARSRTGPSRPRPSGSLPLDIAS